MPEISSPRRIGYLDATRGIAAFMVMIYHFASWKYAENTYVKWGNIIFNGADAVSFFFVLSGFVLAFPYVHYGKSLDIGKFYIRRIFRIFPGFWVALILTDIFYHQKDLWINPLKTLWATFGTQGDQFLKEAVLFFGQSQYLGVDWTLSVELMMSFLMPFLIIFTLKNKRLIVWFSLITFLTINLIGTFATHFAFGIFFTHFALGILAAAYFDEIQSDSFKQTIWFKRRHLILILSFFLFSLRHFSHIFPFKKSILDLMDLFKLDFFMWSGIASFIFLVYIIHDRKIQRILEHRLLLFLGKISYGIYLLHWFIVKFIYDNWDVLRPLFSSTAIALIVMFLVCALLTITLSTALYYWVENPLIMRGKKLVQRMKPAKVISRT